MLIILANLLFYLHFYLHVIIYNTIEIDAKISYITTLLPSTFSGHFNLSSFVYIQIRRLNMIAMGIVSYVVMRTLHTYLLRPYILIIMISS